MDPDTGVFNAPLGGSYMFVFHIATHDNKKALLSIRLNGEEVASVFDQNHKDNHKNSMAGTTILLNLKKGDEVCVYAYTGTWLADFPMNHYTHWVGLLLKPSLEEEDNFLKDAEEKVDSGEMILWTYAQDFWWLPYKKTALSYSQNNYIFKMNDDDEV